MKTLISEMGYPSLVMATVRPFHALRYTASAGEISSLVAPPYDVLSAVQRDEYAAKNPRNVVWLTLPEGAQDDRSQFVKYARSASRLAEWRRDGFLALAGEQGLYRYRQSFVHPITKESQTRTQLMVILKVEPYEKGVVLPHEQTFPKHKQDRLRLLEATRTHLESIYGLYRDEHNLVQSRIEQAEWANLVDIKTEDGVTQTLDVCTDPDQVAGITDAFDAEKIWIADGHHRYETALNFRNEQGEKPGEIAEDYMLISLSSIRDEGLALLPTHRIVNHWTLALESAEQQLQRFFNVRRVGNHELPNLVREHGQPGTTAFGVVLPGGAGLLGTLEDPRAALDWVDYQGSERLKLLDVTVLHNVILEKAFGIEGLDRLEFTRDASEAVSRVAESNNTAAILTNPPSVEDMRVIAERGEKMPQKSTYYYPKLLSGLLFFSLDDF